MLRVNRETGIRIETGTTKQDVPHNECTHYCKCVYCVHEGCACALPCMYMLMYVFSVNLKVKTRRGEPTVAMHLASTG